MARRKHTLANSTIRILNAMQLKAWVHESRIRHNGSEEIREHIRDNLEIVRATGVRGSALFLGAVWLTATDLGMWDEDDTRRLDPLGVGNIGYIQQKLEELGND